MQKTPQEWLFLRFKCNLLQILFILVPLHRKVVLFQDLSNFHLDQGLIGLLAYSIENGLVKLCDKLVRLVFIWFWFFSIKNDWVLTEKVVEVFQHFEKPWKYVELDCKKFVLFLRAIENLFIWEGIIAIELCLYERKDLFRFFENLDPDLILCKLLLLVMVLDQLLLTDSFWQNGLFLELVDEFFFFVL